jgi:hypothetical protein
MTTKTKDAFLFSNLIKNKKLQTLLPDLKKLTAAAKKDIVAIDSEISKLNKKHISDLTSDEVELVSDLERIKIEVEETVKSYKSIVKNINQIWSVNKTKEDEYRLCEVIYAIKFEHGYREFEQVNDVFPFVAKYMKNTIKYLSGFGCVCCFAGSDCEPWQPDAGLRGHRQDEQGGPESCSPPAEGGNPQPERADPGRGEGGARGEEEGGARVQEGGAQSGEGLKECCRGFC